MKLDQLREKQFYFSDNYDELEAEKIISRVKTFQSLYTIDKVRKLPIEEYVFGRYSINKFETFCYWIEMILDDFGRISGSPPWHYGVWFSKKNGIYEHTLKYGNTVEESYKNVLEEIFSLYLLGLAKDYEGISRHKIADKFKGKILSVYFPDQYLSLYADNYLSNALKYFNLDTFESYQEAPIYKQLRLLQWKDNDEIMKKWNLLKFAKFINSELRTHTYIYNENSTKDENNLIPNFPDINSIEFTVINKDIDDKFVEFEHKKVVSHESSKINYLNKNIRDLAIGVRGERLVKEFELRKLRNHPELRSFVDWVSERTDGKGFDIESRELDGTPMQIEVKSTTKKFNGIADFYLTEYERLLSQTLPNYYVYYITNLLSAAPEIWIIKAPFNSKQRGVALNPIVYSVKIISKQ